LKTDASLVRLIESQGHKLQKRGRDSVVRCVDAFKLGYANESLTYRLSPGHTQAGKELRGKLQALGVYRAS
ncbi:MAG: hypothetical protein M3R60_14740, partial [Pseudomonadota bacterium]|nr:hypothetical protein [Pseudomonadota bacterium]